jgi:hypothetical protein
MNCDRVFAILTRGPFPSGDPTDRAVEHHLSTCLECRMFADALRPHDNTDAEPLLPEESRGLPFYWGANALRGEAVVSTAVQGRSPRQQHSFRYQKREPRTNLSGWYLAFAVLTGTLFGALLNFVSVPDEGGNELASAHSKMSSMSPRTIPPVDVDNQLITKLGVTPACLDRRVSRLASVEDRYDHRYDITQAYGTQAFGPGASEITSGSLRCCTECHNATSPRLAMTSSTAKIVRSCQVCHQENHLQPANH